MLQLFFEEQRYREKMGREFCIFYYEKFEKINWFALNSFGWISLIDYFRLKQINNCMV